MSDATQGKEGQSPLLLDFEPLAFLWQDSRPLCPSEQSARWTLRQHRDALVDARAIAILRGRMMIHPQRFREVLEAQAFLALRGRIETK